MNFITLFDMDGTMWDYEGRLREDMSKLAAPGEPSLDGENLWTYLDANPHLKARADLIKRQEGWWRDLPIYEPGWRIYRKVVDLGFKTAILTKAPKRHPRAWMEKFECCQKHLGPDQTVIVTHNENAAEAKAGTFGHVLVDDHPTFVEGWLENRPRGLAIVPAWPHNEGFEHPSAIRYTGDNFDWVVRALEAVLKRKGQEHWREYLR